MTPNEIIQHIESNCVYYTESGCLEWIGYRTPDGYGQFHRKGKTYYAHREMMRAHGHAIDGLTIDHLCERKACCNPKHLEVVPNEENTRRMRDEGWQALLKENRDALGLYERLAAEGA